MAKYTLLKPVAELKETKDILRYRISVDADYLALFLVIKKMIPKVSEVILKDENITVLKEWSIEEDFKHLFKQMKKMLVGETVVMAYPRPHCVAKYFVDYLVSIKETKIIKKFWKIVFEKYCFNENQLFADDINKRAKMSLNNIGFYTFQYFLDSSIGK